MVAALRLGRALPGPLRFVALWWFVGFLQDCVQYYIGHYLHRHNLWVNHVMLPFTTGLLLWAFSLWQESDVPRMAFRIAIPLYGLVWLVLQVAVERFDRYSTYASPISCLLLVCVAAYTIVSLALRSTEPVWRQEWLWIASGYMLYFGSEVVLMPLGNLLFAAGPDLSRIYRIFTVCGLVATLLITGGMLCARPLLSSGGSSWPRRSWRPFSSPPS